MNLKKILKFTGFGLGTAFVVLAVILVLNIFGVVNVVTSDHYEIESRSRDDVITCYVDEEGRLSVNITDPGAYEWRYEPDKSTEKLVEDKADFDGYHFLAEPAGDAGVGYMVVGEYVEDVSTEANSYGVVKFRMESGKVAEILETEHVEEVEEFETSA